MQDRVLTGMPGRVTSAERLNTTDALGVEDRYLLSWKTAIGMLLQAVVEHNDAFVPRLGMSRARYFADNQRVVREVPDEALARLYRPHELDGGRRQVTESGVSIDGEMWVGLGVTHRLKETGKKVRRPWRRRSVTRPSCGCWDAVAIRPTTCPHLLLRIRTVQAVMPLEPTASRKMRRCPSAGAWTARPCFSKGI